MNGLLENKHMKPRFIVHTCNQLHSNEIMIHIKEPSPSILVSENSLTHCWVSMTEIKCNLQRAVLFWFSGASFFVIGLHASLLSMSDTPEITEQITMEEV